MEFFIFYRAKVIGQLPYRSVMDEEYERLKRDLGRR